MKVKLFCKYLSKALSLALCTLMLLPLVSGCVPVNDREAAAGTPAPTELLTEEPAEQPTEQPTDEPTAEPTEEPTAEPTPVPTEAPTEEPTEEPTPAPTPTPKPTKTPKPTATPTPKPTKTPKPTAKPTATPKPSSDYVEPPHHPQPEHDSVPKLTSKSGKYSFYPDVNLFKVDNCAYEQSFYVDSAARKYAELINYAAEQLEGHTKVYSLIIPTKFGVILPDDIAAKIPGYVDTESKIQTVFSYMSGKVKKVSCCHDLRLHRDEFVYFRTDHHWTALGAYYAYRAFCRTKGISHIKLTDRREVKFSGFLGSAWSMSGKDHDLLPKENVYAYYPIANIQMVVYDEDGDPRTRPVISNVASYMCFAGGDNPLTVFTNSSVSSGTLIIIKESFGNALLPFLCDHYHKIYEIDYRYWKGNVIDLANEVGATDLIFANNFAIVSSTSKIGQIAKIVK